MKNKYLAVSVLALMSFAFQACSFSTANLSSLKVSKEKEAAAEASSFNAGETLYAKANVSNNPGKVKVKLYMVAEDAKGLTKGTTVPGSEVSLDVDGDGAANYNLPIEAGLPSGSYKLNADMINESGEKKDSKSAEVRIVGESAPVE